MIMADVFKVLFPVLGTLIALVCFWLLSEALLPAAIGRAGRQYGAHPLRILLVGLLITVPLFLVGGGLLQKGGPGGKFLGACVLVLLLAVALTGAAGLARHIGERLNSAVDQAQPWRRVFRGAVILSLSFLLPLVGWFLVLPITLLTGVGAAVLSCSTAKDGLNTQGAAQA